MSNKKLFGKMAAAVAVLAAGVVLLAGCVDAWVRMPVPPMWFSTIPAGSFTRGSGSGAHQVTLTKTFYMSDHEVTQGEWRAVVGNDGYGSSTPSDTYGKGDDLPMYYVSWYDALVYCNLLSIKEGKKPCYSIKGSTNPDDWGTPPSSWDTDWNIATCDWTANGYRLPTEAEWEYSARGGQGYTYAGSDNIDEVAWYASNSNSKAHAVKGKKPNGFGLYDMSGNVAEWCWDWNESSYDTSQTADPTGASSSSFRVFRGGSWLNDASGCAVSYRYGGIPAARNNNFGFRVVCRP